MSSLNTTQIPWKLVGKEKAEVREKLINHQLNKYSKYGLSRNDAEEATDIWIEAVNETAKDFGEDV